MQILVGLASGQELLQHGEQRMGALSTQEPVIVSQPEDEDATDMLTGLSIQSFSATSNLYTTPSQARMRPTVKTPTVRPPNYHGSPIGAGPDSAGTCGAWPVGLPQPSPTASGASSGRKSILPWHFFGHGAIGQERVPSQYHAQTWSPVAQPNFDFARMGYRRDIEQSSPNHNMVDIERIQNGLDVRTTVSQRSEASCAS